MSPTLQSCIAAAWIGHEPGQTPHSAVNGCAVAATDAEAVDIAAARYQAQRVSPSRPLPPATSLGPACGR